MFIMILKCSGSIKVEIRVMPETHERWKILEDIFYTCEHSCIPVCDYLISECGTACKSTSCFNNISFICFYMCRYERKFVEENKLKQIAKTKDEKNDQTPAGEPESAGENLKSKTSTSEQDLDSFLLGDLDDSDGHPGNFLSIK